MGFGDGGDHAAFGRAIEFGQYQTSHTERGIEGFDLAQRVLPGVGI